MNARNDGGGIVAQRTKSNLLKWFRYPDEVRRNAVAPALIAIGAPAIPAVVVTILLFILGLPAPNFEIGRLSAGFLVFAAFGWIFLMAANVPRAYAYIQRFSLEDKGIVRRLFGMETVLRWEDVTVVEKKKMMTFENRRWIEETYLIIRGERRSFTIFDRLEDFVEFKDSISPTCRRLSIPQFSVDRTLTTLARLREEDPELHRKSRRTGVRTSVDRL